MTVKITKSRGSGKVAAPPSKSYAHRMMICAALSGGVSVVHGIGESEDMAATLDCISSLGVRYEKIGNSVAFYGNERKSAENAVFACRESGSTLRFMIPVALALTDSAVFTGTKRLLERGIGEYEKILPQCGISIEKTDYKIVLRGRMRSDRYTVDGAVSSQFVTGLLFALPLCNGDSEIEVTPPVESRPYIDITLDVLAKYGIKVEEKENNTFEIRGGQSYRSANAAVEGDWSNAAFLYALNTVGSDVTVVGLNENSAQGDKVFLTLAEKLDSPSPVIDLSDCPDLAPVLFALAAFKNGARFTGTRRLRIKESDRAAVMAEELYKFGVQVDVGENEVVVHGGKLRAPSEPLDSHNDHRIAMALSVLSTVTGGEIRGVEAVRKSYPDFFDVLASLGIKTETTND